MKKIIGLALMASFVSLSLFPTHVSLLAADSASHTTSETKEGVVTLGGNPNSEAEKDLSMRIARDVFGVKKGVDAMTVGDKVSPMAPKAPGGLKVFKVIPKKASEP